MCFSSCPYEKGESSTVKREPYIMRLREMDVWLYYKLMDYRWLFIFLKENCMATKELLQDINNIRLLIILLEINVFQKVEPSLLISSFLLKYSPVEQEKLVDRIIVTDLAVHKVEQLNYISNKYWEIKRTFFSNEKMPMSVPVSYKYIPFKVNISSVKALSFYIINSYLIPTIIAEVDQESIGVYDYNYNATNLYTKENSRFQSVKENTMKKLPLQKSSSKWNTRSSSLYGTHTVSRSLSTRHNSHMNEIKTNCHSEIENTHSEDILDITINKIQRKISNAWHSWRNNRQNKRNSGSWVEFAGMMRR